MSFTALNTYGKVARDGQPLYYTMLNQVTLQRPDKLRVIPPGDGVPGRSRAERRCLTHLAEPKAMPRRIAARSFCHPPTIVYTRRCGRTAAYTARRSDRLWLIALVRTQPDIMQHDRPNF